MIQLQEVFCKGFQVPGTFSPAFVLLTYPCSWVISQKVGESMRELSIFIDESGSDNLSDYYYILTIVLHDQSNNLDYSIKLYENSLEQRLLPNIPFHASPLMNKKDNYKCLDMSTRKKNYCNHLEYSSGTLKFITILLYTQTENTNQQVNCLRQCAKI